MSTDTRREHSDRCTSGPHLGAHLLHLREVERVEELCEGKLPPGVGVARAENLLQLLRRENTQKEMVRDR